MKPFTGLRALTIAAEGGKADIAKPFTGFGSGGFRVIYTVQLGTDLWVVHAFQKKSKTGSKTPREELEVVRVRLRRLREVLA